MKLTTILSAFCFITLASAECNWQNFGCGFNEKCWRLSTYHSENCKNQAGTWTRKGLGHHCINLPGKTRSFIFNVSPNYNEPFGRCVIFFQTGNKCGGKQVGRSSGSWKKSKLNSEGKKMNSAVVQCTSFNPHKRDVTREQQVANQEGLTRAFSLGDDGEWYE